MSFQKTGGVGRMDAGGAYTGYTPPPGGIYHTQDAADILQVQPFASQWSLPLRKEGDDPSHPPIIEDEASFKPSRGWAEMIKKVYEVDPLLCPKCRGRGDGRIFLKIGNCCGGKVYSIFGFFLGFISGSQILWIIFDFVCFDISIFFMISISR